MWGHRLIATISLVSLSCATYTVPNPLECDFPQLYSPLTDTPFNNVPIQSSAHSSLKRYKGAYELQFPFPFLTSSTESSNSILQEFISFHFSYSSLNITVLSTLHEGEERFALWNQLPFIESSALPLAELVPKSTPILIDYPKSYQLLPTDDT